MLRLAGGTLPAGIEPSIGGVACVDLGAGIGLAPGIDVVTAVSSAEASLETVMAVRDQVISAYQEIMRMPI